MNQPTMPNNFERTGTRRSPVYPCLFRFRSFGTPTLSAVTEAMGAVVQARGVSKWFGETTALDTIDFAVSPGAVHGLLGPHGAGKTTLLSALFGLVLPDEGTLKLFGRTLPAATWVTDRQLIRNGMTPKPRDAATVQCPGARSAPPVVLASQVGQGTDAAIRAVA